MDQDLLEGYPEHVKEAVKRYNTSVGFWKNIRTYLKDQIGEQYNASLPIELVSPGVVGINTDGTVDATKHQPIFNRCIVVVPTIIHCTKCGRSMAMNPGLPAVTCCGEDMGWF